VLGGRLALEAVRSGAGRVYLWDFDTAHPENQGNQIARAGELKVRAIARACDQIRPGVLRAFPHDIRHAGIRTWMQCQLIVDCSDDPALAWPLTETSNGTGTPLLRCAVDGHGRWELARVSCSSGATGHACQLCPYSASELTRALRRTPCATPDARGRQETLAGNAIAMAASGLALLQAQRLVTGNDAERVLGREVILDLSHHQLLDGRLERCPQCLSGHRTWKPTELTQRADSLSLGDLFQMAEKLLGKPSLTLAGYQHPLNTQASCRCGCVQPAAGTDWATPPSCCRCGSRMTWLREIQIDRISRTAANELGVLDANLADLGVPTDGAMFLARGPGRLPQRLLLAADAAAELSLGRSVTP
jgi:hypothetical protein